MTKEKPKEVRWVEVPEQGHILLIDGFLNNGVIGLAQLIKANERPDIKLYQSIPGWHQKHMEGMMDYYTLHPKCMLFQMFPYMMRKDLDSAKKVAEKYAKELANKILNNLKNHENLQNATQMPPM